jgi:signal transduction histidine kinase
MLYTVAGLENEPGDGGALQLGSWELLPVIGGLSHFLAHDLGNALSALTITLDMVAARPELADKPRELVRRALGLEGRLQGLVDALGALGGARLKSQPLDLPALLAAILRQLRLGERFQLEVELQPLDQPRLVLAPNLLELCLRLLLRNAAEATPPGGRLGLRSTAADGWLRLTVWDEGEGVAPELRHKLFREVFSTKASSGVGLLLVRAAAEGSLQGRVSYAPNTPRGSSFSILLGC